MTGKLMDRWLKRKAPDDVSNQGPVSNANTSHEPHQQETNVRVSAPEEINWEEEIQFDPGKRKDIRAYHPNLRDSVRRKYLLNGPCQPCTLDFLGTWIGAKCRRFNPEWFDEFGNWFEYNESTDKAYCFTCFLFRDPTKKGAVYKLMLQTIVFWCLPTYKKTSLNVFQMRFCIPSLKT